MNDVLLKEFVQRRTATLRPYWLYFGLTLAAVLFLRPWIGALFAAAILGPRVLIPARLRVGSDGLVMSAWLSKRHVAWSEITSASIQGKGWSESVRLDRAGDAGRAFLNIGYFDDRPGIVNAIVAAVGADHPLSRAVTPPPP